MLRWRLHSGLELLRVRNIRQLVLDHFDFTDYWAAKTYPDRKLSPDLELRIRNGAIHFLGDLEVSKEEVSIIWRAETLLEACDKYPSTMTQRRFIVVRPFGDSDVEIENPCDQDQLIVRPLR